MASKKPPVPLFTVSGDGPKRRKGGIYSLSNGPSKNGAGSITDAEYQRRLKAGVLDPSAPMPGEESASAAFEAHAQAKREQEATTSKAPPPEKPERKRKAPDDDDEPPPVKDTRPAAERWADAVKVEKSNKAPLLGPEVSLKSAHEIISTSDVNESWNAGLGMGEVFAFLNKAQPKSAAVAAAASQDFLQSRSRAAPVPPKAGAGAPVDPSAPPPPGSFPAPWSKGPPAKASAPDDPSAPPPPGSFPAPWSEKKAASDDPQAPPPTGSFPAPWGGAKDSAPAEEETKEEDSDKWVPSGRRLRYDPAATPFAAASGASPDTPSPLAETAGHARASREAKEREEQEKAEAMKAAKEAREAAEREAREAKARAEKEARDAMPGVYGFATEAGGNESRAIALRLEPIKGNLPEFERVLNDARQSIVIGSKRGGSCDVTVMDDAVSKKHCSLALIGLKGELALSVVDHSTNGTWVNGERLPVKNKRYRIRSGDKLVVKDKNLEEDFGWTCDFGNTVSFFARA